MVEVDNGARRFSAELSWHCTAVTWEKEHKEARTSQKEVQLRAKRRKALGSRGCLHLCL